MIDRDQLTPLLTAWAPKQRWFGGKGREAAMSVDLLAVLPDDSPVEIWTLTADYGEGSPPEIYQVPLVARSEPVDSLDHVLLGTVDSDGGTRWVYDALHDKELTPAWLKGMRDNADEGTLRFERFAESPDDIPVDESSLVLTGEQSNTSMVFGDVAIMKVFRRLHPGINPDIEIEAALTKLGAKHVPALLGSVEAVIDGEPWSLAFLQEFLTTASDGWELAKISVRDLMAEADLHASEAGGDFASEAERLGEAVANVHSDLASAFGTQQASADELRERSDAMTDRLQRAVEIVPELGEVAAPLHDLFRALADVRESVTLQRIHGDLHLGQALRSVVRWVLIDFEGEPMAAIDARRRYDFALRDIAGMLRSFDYAGYHQLLEIGWDQQLNYRAGEWSMRNRDAFCAGYAAVAGADPRAHDVLLRAFLADKAVYEAVYEARNRPAWLPIPLASLTRLATDEGSLS
jgi:maltokinase